VIDINNCYSYACDWPWGRPPKKGLPQPGDKSGNKFDNFPGGKPSCTNIIANAKRDGLIFPMPKGGCPSTSHKVCLYVTDDSSGFTDYHWYRQDSDGYWSDKPGGTEIQKCYEGTGIPVTDPTKDAKESRYPIKCGCFCATGKPR
jgi:hypothetical protein